MTSTTAGVRRVNTVCLSLGGLRQFFRACAAVRTTAKNTSIQFKKGDVGVLNKVSSLGRFEVDTGDPKLNARMSDAETVAIVDGLLRRAGVGPFTVKPYIDGLAAEARANLETLRELESMARQSTRDFALTVARLNLGLVAVKASLESTLAVTTLLVPARKVGPAEGIYFTEQLIVAAIEDWAGASNAEAAAVVLEEWATRRAEEAIKSSYKGAPRARAINRLKFFSVGKDIAANIVAVNEARALLLEADATFH